MAAANSDSWVRDQVADENPHLARKRPRLSEEADDTSPLSADDSIIVEAVPPDSDGSNTSISSGIEVIHDLDTMGRFSDSFQLDPAHKLAPVDQLGFLINTVRSEQYLSVKFLIELADWLYSHTKNVPSDTPKLKQAYLVEDIEFFSKLGTLCAAIFTRHGELLGTRDDSMLKERHVAQLCTGAVALGFRLLNYMPGLVDAAIQRRDSGQIAPGRQQIELLNWVQVLSHNLALRRALGLAYFKNLCHYRPNAAATDFKQEFRESEVLLKSVLGLLQRLCAHHREIINSWEVMDGILRIVTCLNISTPGELEVVVDAVRNFILPTVCEKHPRALPDGFHEGLVVCSSQALRGLIKSARSDDRIVEIYERYIKTDKDALLLDSTADRPIFSALLEVSDQDRSILAENLIIAWVLHVLDSYIHSDIMDVRTSGISELGHRLVNLYNAHHPTNDDKASANQPILCYIARFMRANEMTKYIFGPNSHAGLVSHSQNIIGFLAATSSYTDHDTDLIWHACTNSVESEFVKASFAVLADICRYLDLDHLLYLANKYATTEPSKLGKDAVESLTDLLQKVHLKNDQTDDPQQLLTTAFISIEIMKRASCTDSSTTMGQLRNVARNELYRFTSSQFSAESRTAIVKRCIPDIIDKSDAATTSFEILTLFLRNTPSYEEFADMVSMLPVSVAVAEFAHFTDHQRHLDTRFQESGFVWLEARFEVIVRLMTLADSVDAAVDGKDFSVLWQYTVGESALGNDARDIVWQLLAQWASPGNTTSWPKLSIMASVLLDKFLGSTTADLPVRYITSRLVHLFTQRLPVSVVSGSNVENFDRILESNIWQKLVEIAQAAPATDITQLAAEAICYVLFKPSVQSNHDGSVARCHTEFTRRLTRQVCDEFASLPDVTDEHKLDSLGQKIDLLDWIVRRSKENLPSAGSAVQPDIELVSKQSDSDVSYLVQLYGLGQSEARLHTVRANNRTTVKQLSAALPDITGADSNRIILGGKIIDLTTSAGKLLSDLGLQPSGVISVCPKHTSESKLEKVLTSPGPVEQEILVQFDAIEGLLNGLDPIAKKIHRLLLQVSPPAQARARITSNVLSPSLFAANHCWKGAYYLHVLQRHLMDFAQLGVADGDFLARGIYTLVEILRDDACTLHVDYCIGAMKVLTTFLQECSTDSTNIAIPEPESFTSRLVTICQDALQRPENEAPVRREVIDSAHTVLHQAFRRQDSIWQKFITMDNVTQLYADILFDGDIFLASHACASISNFCTDSASPEEVADFYMRTILNIAPQALEHRDRASQFFTLAIEVLLKNRKLHGDECRVRAITQTLISMLWVYKHSESVDLPVLDTTMAGLLQLLTETIKVLKSFKKALELGSLSTDLFGRLLFPPQTSSESRPLVHSQSRQLVYSLVKAACETHGEYIGILRITLSALEEERNSSIQKFPGPSVWMRPAFRCAGLDNLGMTCYMNSLLQQLFANVHFRKFLLQTKIVDVETQALLVEVQKLFAKMQDSYAPAIDTTPLARTLDIRTDSQEDVHGFYEDFLSKLESAMPDQDSKSALTKFFTGKLISQIKGECGHVSPKTEPFVDLPVVVKNKASLSESLDEYVQGEPLEGANKYKCQACDSANGGQLVDAMRRSCPEEMPDNLTFCLKRFTFEAMLGLDGKVNDRFEFPQTIDMARYQKDHLEDPNSPVTPDIFELVGVIVHQGTLQLGHYWSYTLLRSTGNAKDRTWVKLEDRNVSLCQHGLAEVQHECFGGLQYTNGNERPDNAYVLMYQRKAALEEQIALQNIVQDYSNPTILPSKVELPQALAEEIHKENAWRCRKQHLFDAELSSLVEWLLGEAKHFDISAPSPTRSSSSSEEQEATQDVDAKATADATTDLQKAVKLLARVVVSYVQRVGVADQTPVKKLTPAINGLKQLIVDHSSVAFYAIDQLVGDHDWLFSLIAHETKNVRNLMNKLIWHCLDLVRDHDNSAFLEIVGRIRRVHAAHLRTGSHMGNIDWHDYLGFATNIAKISPAETAAVLDEGYWNWAVQMLALPHELNLQQKLPGLAEHMKTSTRQVSSVYRFLHDLLDREHGGYVVIPDLDDCSPDLGPRSVDGNAVLLRERETKSFFAPSTSRKPVQYWLQSAKLADHDCAFEDSTPGRLLELLVQSAAPSDWVSQIEHSLLTHIESDEESLSSLLGLAVHYARVAEDLGDVQAEFAIRLFRALLKTLPLWQGHESEVAGLIRDVYHEAEATILATLDEWVPAWLQSKFLHVRKQTSGFLIQVFDDEPELGRPDLEVTRANQARALVRILGRPLREACESSKSRVRWEATIDVFSRIGAYLQELLEAVASTKKVPPNLLVECDEAKQTIVDLDDLGAAIADWDSVSVSVDEIGVRKSVEETSEVDSDEDWDSDSDSPLQ